MDDDKYILMGGDNNGKLVVLASRGWVRPPDDVRLVAGLKTFDFYSDAVDHINTQSNLKRHKPNDPIHTSTIRQIHQFQKERGKR